MDFRQRLEQSREKQAVSVESLETEENYVCEYFATDNIKSMPACLDLRMPNGFRKALPYSFFTEINFDNEIGIEILTTGKRIKINGRNLTKLFDYLVNYRVRYVQANIGNDQPDEGLFVQEIIIEEIPS